MYPQVRKTGVDAVHASCPQKVYLYKSPNSPYEKGKTIATTYTTTARERSIYM